MVRAHIADGYPMGEAIDEATFVVRKCLENPKYDSVRPKFDLLWWRRKR
jgi:hypothetical protein